jgi:hypothetical protein
MRTILLSLLLMALSPVAVQAQFTWITNNGTITITGYTGSGGLVIIPETINGLSVTHIGDQAFAYSAKLTNVSIGNNVTNIGISAFRTCTNLVGVTIPDSVTLIGSTAFYECASLTSVAISAEVNTIGDGAFKACINLTSINVNPLNSAYSSAGGVLFNKNQSSLIQCSGGKAGGYAIPNTVTSIITSAFERCGNLTSVTMTNSVISIGSWAFYGCTNLATVAIGSSVTIIGFRAFTSCSSLMALDVDPFNSAYSSLGGVLFNKNQTDLLIYPRGKAGGYVIPNTVATIGVYAFEDSAALTSVTIPDSVTSIEPASFYGCASLVNVTIPSGVTSVTNAVFAWCTSLTSVTIPSTVTNIGLSAFAWCTNLNSISIPSSVTSIGMFAFDHCTSLLAVTIPSSVTTLQGNAFAGCTSLMGLYFEGNAPVIVGQLPNPNQHATEGLTVYRLTGASGWGSMYGGRPTVLWLPLIQSIDTLTNEFGFKISWAKGATVVIEECTNIVSVNWFPLQTNTFVGSSLYFSDSRWTNSPSRFYRVRSP